MLSGLIGFSIAILVAILFFFFLADAFFLWLGARLLGVPSATFGRAFVTNLYIAMATAAISAGVWLVVSANGLTGLITAPRLLNAPQWIALGLALVAWPAITLSFLRGGFEVTWREALGVWAASKGVKSLFALAAALIFGLVVVTAGLCTNGEGVVPGKGLFTFQQSAVPSAAGTGPAAPHSSALAWHDVKRGGGQIEKTPPPPAPSNAKKGQQPPRVLHTVRRDGHEVRALEPKGSTD